MIHLYGRDEKLLCILENEKEGACPYFDAEMREVLNGEFTLQFTVPYFHECAHMIKEDGYVIVKDINEEYQLFCVTRIEDRHGREALRTVFCEQAQVELLDEIIQDMTIPKSSTAREALTLILAGSRWKVGSVTDTTIISTPFVLKNVDKLDALMKVRGRWRGDITFRFEIYDTTFYRYVDLTDEKGVFTGRRFEYTKDLHEITRETDTSNLKTAIIGVGGTDDNPIDFKGVTWTTPTNPWSKPAGQAYIADESARAKYGRLDDNGNRQHLWGFLKSSEEDPAALLQLTWEKLKELREPRVKYSLNVVDLDRVLSSNMGEPVIALGLKENAMNLTGWMETSKQAPDMYGVTGGNFDGMGISHGVLQFNFGKGSLQPIWRELILNYPQIVDTVFTNATDKAFWIDMVLNKTVTEQIAWGASITNPSNAHDVIQPWKTYFSNLGRQAPSISLQIKAAEWFYGEAFRWMPEYLLWTKRGFGLMFDIAVQSGSMPQAVKDLIMQDYANMNTTGKTDEQIETERMIIIANRRADAVSAEWRDVYRERKLAVANGYGVIYSGTQVVDTDAFGMTLTPYQMTNKMSIGQIVRLGDYVNVIDRDLGVKIQARVLERFVDLNLKDNSKIVLGQHTEALTKTVGETEIPDFDIPNLDDLLHEGDRIDTAWLEGEISALQNRINAGGGTVTISDQGILVVDPNNSNRAIILSGGILGIANTKTNGVYDWRTFGTGDGFTADHINAGSIRAALVMIMGDTNFFWNGTMLKAVNPANSAQFWAFGKLDTEYGIGYTSNGGATWRIRMDKNGLKANNGSYDTFVIDANGNASFGGSLAAGVYIQAPDINGGTITGGTINGGIINGGTITAGTTIDVGTDLKVGNNAYLGTLLENAATKTLFFSDAITITARGSSTSPSYQELSLNSRTINLNGSFNVNVGRSTGTVMIYGTIDMSYATYINMSNAQNISMANTRIDFSGSTITGLNTTARFG